MAKFETNLEVIPASQVECDTYCQTAARKINSLLEKYDIHNAAGMYSKVSEDEFRAMLSCAGFFQDTPLKSIFFGQGQQFVPQEVIQAYRSFISSPPANIKAFLFNNFLVQLESQGWGKQLCSYFQTEYNFSADGIIILDDIKDFSLGHQVYRATFQLRSPKRERVTVFLKGSHGLCSHNELLYFKLQKQLLATASHARMPCVLDNSQGKQALLLSPQIPGIAADTLLSILAEAYRNTKSNDYRSNLTLILDTIIEAFITHAALGDLLGRNDRHLMNSMIAIVHDGAPQNTSISDLHNPDTLTLFAKNIATLKTRAISLIDFDLKWLLDEKNAHWALADIDFGLSELNLLSLLNEFNDFDPENTSSFEVRQHYIEYYFNIYCHIQLFILKNKGLMFSAIKEGYPDNVSGSKLNKLHKTIDSFEGSNTAVIELFQRYLLNYRIRLAYKTTLFSLDNLSKSSKDTNLLKALKDANLLIYIPHQDTISSHESSVFLQLQCFRGVLSKNDSIFLSDKNRTCWETVAENISMIAKKFSNALFNELEQKTQFIKNDTAALLTFTQASEAFSPRVLKLL